MERPKISYTIWFSQRVGSSLLCQALESTGIAGLPGEWLKKDLWDHFDPQNPYEFQKFLWAKGSTPNGVLGIKQGLFYDFDPLWSDTFKSFPGLNNEAPSPVELWEHAFPYHKHIFLTRRNKINLVVSWWRAIKTEEWHRKSGDQPKEVLPNLKDQYDFTALLVLLIEANKRELAIQNFLNSGPRTALTLVYEDMIQDLQGTVNQVLGYLGLESATIADPYYEITADEVTREWASRFWQDLQGDWKKKIV